MHAGMSGHQYTIYHHPPPQGNPQGPQQHGPSNQQPSSSQQAPSGSSQCACGAKIPFWGSEGTAGGPTARVSSKTPPPSFQLSKAVVEDTNSSESPKFAFLLMFSLEACYFGCSRTNGCDIGSMLGPRGHNI
ncbi:hypothetical protein J437_LFUL008409 [Ladona fulva]|uniref:Uncharacterized protein n=1 Tax=Ladona fulva TaxID=123851 RepID=A0A8K0K3B5_LADFU|nr:hypothetical protein J437_LFUL008409 [Ladona fulva]